MRARVAKKVWGRVFRGERVRWTTEVAALTNPRVLAWRSRWHCREHRADFSRLWSEELLPAMARGARELAVA